MKTGRLRTVLTMLGIVIGVASATALSGITAGLSDSYRVAFDNFGKSISVTPSLAPTSGGNAPRSLYNTDVDALRRDSDPSVVVDVVPTVIGEAMVRSEGTSYRASIIGTSAGYPAMRGIMVTDGRIFTEQEYDGNGKVILLGPALVQALFGGDVTKALHSRVQIGKLSFEVVGILGPDGQGDATALMPMTAARSYLFGGKRTVQSIWIVAPSIAATAPATAELNRILDRQHFIKNPAKRDYMVTSAEFAISMVNSVMSVQYSFMAGITSVVLIIATVGLANIMLITVTERTREIGVRRALGARRATIMRQFLIESVILAGFGGLIGMAFGLVLTMLGGKILPIFVPAYGKPSMPYETAVLAFFLSLVIGLAAGGYPALRAARLQPWDALRF